MQEQPLPFAEYKRLPKNSLFRRILFWAPVSTIILLIFLCFGSMLYGGMARVIAWYVLQFGLPLLGLFTLAMVVIYAIWKRAFNKAMFATLLLSFVALGPMATLLGIIPITYPVSADAAKPSATVRLPANVPLKVLQGGDHVSVNYHAAFPGQRWAYDLIVEPNIPGSERLEDYGCYGIPVVAPVSGHVTTAHDGEPDMKPGKVSMNFKAPLGNHVVIKMATETYLIIAHLKPNSVSVANDQNVIEGQLIGECGNSGNTSLPHIHIHHQRQDPAIYPVMIDEGLPLYFRDHDGPPMPQGGIKKIDGQIIATGAVVRHIAIPDSMQRPSEQ